MRHQIVNTARNTLYQDSQLIQIIPKNDRVLSPRNDKSLERRTKSIPHSQISSMLNSSTLPPSDTTQVTIKHPQHPSILQIDRKIYQQFKNDLTKYIQQNSKLRAENQILAQNNKTLNNKINQTINLNNQQKSSKDDNTLSESYYARFKDIQQHIALYQLQSRANIIYSQCLLQISRCLSRQQLTINQLRSQITQLMSECDSYKQQIKRISQVSVTKEYNMNQELQKIILQFNQAIFSKNDLQIKIFDLTTQNNQLKSQISNLISKLQQQQYEIKKLNTSSSRLGNSRVGPRIQNSLPQLKINLQHYERQNQHLKIEIETYRTKMDHYHGSELNYKQEIGRLNNFISELNTKWNVEFEHNGVLQEERSNHLKEVMRLGGELQRWSLKNQEVVRSNQKMRMENEMLMKEKRLRESELDLTLENLKRERENSLNVNNYNDSLQKQAKSLHLQISQFNDTIIQITKNSQNKQNNYLQQLNNLRQQIYTLQTQIYQSNNSLIQKQQQMRILSQEYSVNNSTAIEFIKNQSRLELQRQKNHTSTLNEKIKQLEEKILLIHKSNLGYETELSTNRMAMFDFENKFKLKCVEYQETIQRIENMFGLERETLIHTKGLVENQLMFAHQRVGKLEVLIEEMKGNQQIEYQNMTADNELMVRRLEDADIFIESLNRKLVMMQEIEEDRNRYRDECYRLEVLMNNRGVEIDEFIKRTNDEQVLRRQSFEEQIRSLSEIIERSQDEKKVLREEKEQFMAEMMKRQNELRNVIVMKQGMIQDKRKGEEELKHLIEGFKNQISSQMLNLRKDFVEKVHFEYTKNADKQLQQLLTQYQSKINSISQYTINFINKQQINLEQFVLNQLNLIKDSFSTNFQKTSNDLNSSLNNLKTTQRINNLKLSNLQTQTKTLQQIFRKLSSQFSSQLNINQQNTFQLQFSNRQLQTLKQTNFTLTSILSSSEQNILSLKNDISNWNLKYDKLKTDLQLNEDTYSEQIKSLKITITQLEKHNQELLTKLAFAEHDRTIERLNSMPDLNRSLENHRSRVQINVGTEKDIRNRQNPEVILVEDGQTVIKTSNRVNKLGEAQVVVNIIQKDQDYKDIKSPNNNRRVDNQDGFGMLPYMLNEQPNSPTHRMCFAGSKRKSRSPPIVIPQNIQIINRNYPRQTNLINEEEEFVVRNRPAKIRQIPYIPISNEIPQRLKPTSPPINRIQTIKSSTSQPVIHFPDTSFNSPSNLNNVYRQHNTNTNVLHSNSQVYVNRVQEIRQNNNNSNSQIRY